MCLIVAKKLIALRGDRTQEEVAEAVGISRTALSNYEQGLRIPRDEIKIKLAKYFEKSVSEIFFDEKVHD